MWRRCVTVFKVFDFQRTYLSVTVRNLALLTVPRDHFLLPRFVHYILSKENPVKSLQCVRDAANKYTLQ